MVGLAVKFTIGHLFIANVGVRPTLIHAWTYALRLSKKWRFKKGVDTSGVGYF